MVKGLGFRGEGLRFGGGFRVRDLVGRSTRGCASWWGTMTCSQRRRSLPSEYGTSNSTESELDSPQGARVEYLSTAVE